MRVSLKEEYNIGKVPAFCEDLYYNNNKWLVLDNDFRDQFGRICYKVNAKNGYNDLGYWLIVRDQCDIIEDFKIELSEDLFVL